LGRYQQGIKDLTIRHNTAQNYMGIYICNLRGSNLERVKIQGFGGEGINNSNIQLGTGWYAPGNASDNEYFDFVDCEFLGSPDIKC
jgi:hypothetical protein